MAEDNIVKVTSEDLLKALEAWYSAKTDYDKAWSEYSGCEWGYHGFYHQKHVDDTKEQFTKIFDELIDQRITLALQHYGIAPQA